MKKTIVILMTVSMLLSLMSITSFGATVITNESVWTQNFDSADCNSENSTIYPNVKKSASTYAEGGRYASASSGGVNYANTGGIDGTPCFYFYGSSGTASGAKVKVNQSGTFEVGKTYVFKAKVYFEPKSDTTTSKAVSLSCLLGTGSTQPADYKNSKETTVNAKEWTTIESGQFMYTYELANYTNDANRDKYDSVNTYGLNARLDSTLTQKTATDDVFDKIYVDDFEVVEVKTETKQIFENVVKDEEVVFDFDDADTYSLVDDTDYETNSKNSLEVKCFDASYGNSLYMQPSSTGGSRLVLSKVFNAADHLGKSYKVSAKIYPVSAEGGSQIRFGHKATEQANTSWGEFKTYTVGTDLISDTWNEISFYYTGGYYKDNSANLFLDGIGFTHNITDNKYWSYYIDDITITPINYFTKADGSTVETTADAGYYADTKDAAEKTGAIAINSFVGSNNILIGRYTNFGLYLYRADDKETKYFVKTLDIDEFGDDLKAENGYISALVEGIKEADFDKYIVAQPFVIVKGITFYGDEFTYCVNDAKVEGELKWLGPVPTTR